MKERMRKLGIPHFMPPVFFYLVLPFLVVGGILLLGIFVGYWLGRSSTSSQGSLREPEIPRRIKGDRQALNGEGGI